MSLAAGSRLGPYAIVSALGAGGMGEVYRARDSRLNRDVAIKVLPDLFALDADRLARFTREAQTLAALNHPNIAHIHGLENSGGLRALVMELVEGEDLSSLIARGPMRVADALPIARQIADALEAAHEQGIVHRDLKPANVRIRPDGTVKVLDFGLAKAVSPDGALATADAMQSPTLTAHATELGIILGTAAYMSPEQARGRTIDRRTDVWAFGCVLYEMLTGARAFRGRDVSETIAAILRDEPAWTAVPDDLPPAIAVFLRRCLAKSPGDRVQAIGDVRLALEGAFDAPAGVRADSRLARGPLPRWLWLAASVLLVLASGISAWLLKPVPGERTQPRRQFVMAPAPGPLAIANVNRDVAITPDGTRLVYLAGQGAGRTLYAWPLDALSPTVLRQGERFFEPFVSPDSKWVAFIDESDFTLRKVPVTGGPPVTIASVGHEIAGATWGPDGTIVFAFAAFGSGLQRLPPTGGSPVAFTAPDKTRGEVGHFWPEFLPGGQAVIYTVLGGAPANQFQIWAIDLRTNVQTKLVENGTGARFSATGHLVYAVEGALWAVRFDPGTLQLQGDAVRVIEAVVSKPTGAVDFAISTDGSLVYVGASASATRRRLSWADRATGARQPIDLPPRAYMVARVSPDGSKVAFDIRDEEFDIWIWDIARNLLTRLTNDPRPDRLPVWTPDGLRLIFASERSGVDNLFARAADGTGPVERLTESPLVQAPGDVTSDGRVIYSEIGARTRLDVLMLPLAGPTRSPTPLLQTTAVERNPQVSPDGKWLALGSNENDPAHQEIYVRPFPGVAGGKVQISSGGGAYPMWLPRTGSELFYVRPDGRLVSVAMRDGAPIGQPKVVVDAGFYIAPHPRSFDVSPDGKRFLLIENPSSGTGSTPSGMVVVLNWQPKTGGR